MSDILESVRARADAFRLQSVADYVALQLARKLNDLDRLPRYSSLLDHYPLGLLAAALAQAQARRTDSEGLASAFDEEIQELLKGGLDGP